MTFHTDRRKFLGASLALPLLHTLSSAQDEGDPALSSAPAKKVLVLGGTKFLGPAIVEAAVKAGYEVTLFNRGLTNPSLFPELEKLRGDRDTGDFGALEGRKWDFVVDTSGYVPAHVADVATLLADNVGHYVFISTLSVYDESGSGIVDESSKVLRADADKVAAVKEIGDVFKRGYNLYGPLKALCEEAAEAAMPGRTTSLRAGLIVGPDDGSDRFTYWPVRVNRGGNVLAPGDPKASVQFIDVRDLGEFAVHCGVNAKAGVFNSVGFEGELTMEELLHGAKVVTGSNTSFTWVDDDFLMSKKVGIYMELPLWIPTSMQSDYSNAAAREAGLKFRPVGETIEATLEWHQSRRPEGYDFPSAGMAREREASLLADWAAQEAKKTAGDGDSE